MSPTTAGHEEEPPSMIGQPVSWAGFVLMLLTSEGAPSLPETSTAVT